MSNVIRLVRTQPTRANDSEERAVYTVVEAARLLSLSRGNTYTLVRNGTIPAKKVGARWLIPKCRFHAWLDGLTEGGED
ncbi:helix-turn-helix domain-containing protein [Microbispora bryophytorum]|uniref:helix-turn-helix domain-containing protein n=1 Tax=Microbispora bryophytorum TaxID=1460882 RepID=UPI00340DE913